MAGLNCFKAYDIRGRLGDELNTDIAYRIGRAYGECLSPRRVVVGGDARETSESLKLALARGLQDAGVDVLDLGLAGTEEIYFATSFLADQQVDGGIEVTASHNPIDYNGMKLVTQGSRPVTADNGLLDIKLCAEQNHFQPRDPAQRGRYKAQSVLEEYTEHLLSYVNLAQIKPLKLVVNSGNGAAGHVIDALETRFKQAGVPVELHRLHHRPDPTFPHGIPNPLLPENRQDTTDAVLAAGADMGIAFDGDFDRCFLFDEHGQFIEGYYIVGLLAQAFLQKNPGQKIIHDPRLIWNTRQVVSAAGGQPVMSQTGHAYIKQKMREEDAVYGGEMSAHHYFRDFAYCDSGMIPWLLVTELLSVSGKSLSALVAERIAAFPSSGEINSSLPDPAAAMQRVIGAFAGDALSVDMTDGFSAEFADWRFNLRSSNTEPVVRLNVESRGDPVLVQEKSAEILKLLRSER